MIKAKPAEIMTGIAVVALIMVLVRPTAPGSGKSAFTGVIDGLFNGWEEAVAALYGTKLTRPNSSSAAIKPTIKAKGPK